MLPKHTQLQKSTLAIQVPTPMLSELTRPPARSGQAAASAPAAAPDARAAGEAVVAGAGTMAGLMPSSTAVPVRPTTAERRKPGFDRSIKYHSTGLTNASVSETCSVDCQGSLRWRESQ